MPAIKIAPSIISADFGRLGEQVGEAQAAGADWFHIDVMDGQFVPNITIGPLVVEAMRSLTSLPLEVHLMIVQPERYLEAFARAGAQRLIVHVEGAWHVHRSVQAIKELGLEAGITLNPATPLLLLEELLPLVDMVMLMSVNPGFSGQRFIPASLQRLRRVREMLDAIGSPAVLHVDGGVTVENVGAIVAAGATAVVSASAIFNRQTSVAENIGRLRGAAQQAADAAP